MDSSTDTGSIPGAVQFVDDVSLLLDADDDDSDFGPMAQDPFA